MMNRKLTSVPPSAKAVVALVVLSSAVCLAGLTGAAAEGVVSWPAPAGEALSEHYEVTVERQAESRCIRAGCRPGRSTSFGRDTSGRWTRRNWPPSRTGTKLSRPEVEIVSRQAAKSVVVRPLSRSPSSMRWTANRIRFRLVGRGAGRGRGERLPPGAAPVRQPPWGAAAAPKDGAPGVLYFGPGVHKLGQDPHGEQPDGVRRPPGRRLWGPSRGDRQRATFALSAAVSWTPAVSSAARAAGASACPTAAT